jgi:hypothetical protein
MHPNDRWRCYRQRVRNGRMVPDMPDIGLDKIAFLFETSWPTSAKPAIGGRSDARMRLLQINPEIANQTTVLAT